MKYARLYTGTDGETHYEDLEMELRPVPGRSSHGCPWAATEAIFLSSVEDSGASLNEWHPAPAHQFIVTLSGTTEIEASDGEIRRFGPGQVLMVADTSGKGHRTRYQGARSALHIPIAG